MAEEYRHTRLPMRERGGKWEVLISEPHEWRPFESREDAKAYADAEILLDQVLEGTHSGPSFTAKLRRTVGVFEKYGLNCPLSRKLKRCLSEIKPPEA